VLQLDSVNVAARAHYMPLFSRHGSYSQAGLDAWLWDSGEAFEHWGHEASVMPRDLLHAMHLKMTASSNWKTRARDYLEAERPGLIEQVLDAVEAAGPLTAADIDHLAPRGAERGTWWDRGHVKDALDHLFMTGQVAVSRRGNFARTYNSTQRVWDLPPAAPDGAGAWGLSHGAARQELFDRAITATGVGTVKDLLDHFRLQLTPRSPGALGGTALAASAVERGLAQWVDVDGWDEPALLAAGAEDPGRATGVALLSPFDPVCWFRPRLERMFGMEYRIEIYTPEAKRIYGYYTLPFLMGDQMVGRFDLKADRTAGVLRVQSSWREERAVAGARRRSDGEIAEAVAGELELMAQWLGLGAIEVVERGNLAQATMSAT